MKLININIEGDKHFDTVIPFIEKEKPDVLCLQEIFRKDETRFQSLGYTCSFLPMTQKMHDGTWSEFGTLLCSRGGMRAIQTAYYLNGSNELPHFDNAERSESISEVKYGVLSAIVDHEDTPYQIATTHFTWTPDGAVPSDAQRESMGAFLAHIKNLPAHVISGDFNIPRHHNPLYGELIQHYKDAVPETYASSLDPTKHRLGNDPDKRHLFTDYMVDYVLVQEPYGAEDVRLEFGISDHAAVVATITRDS